MKPVNTGSNKVSKVDYFDLLAEESSSGNELFAEELPNVRSMANCVGTFSSALTSGCACVSSVGTAACLSR